MPTLCLKNRKKREAPWNNKLCACAPSFYVPPTLAGFSKHKNMVSQRPTCSQMLPASANAKMMSKKDQRCGKMDWSALQVNEQDRSLRDPCLKMNKVKWRGKKRKNSSTVVCPEKLGLLPW
jgi:hypothetical protein